MAKKMQKMAAVIGMMAAMVFGYSCTKEFNIEPTGISTSWGGSKGTSSTKTNVWEEIDENFKFFIKINSDDPIETARPIGAYGEAAKVVTVEAEEYLFGVKYVEGKLSSEKADWESGEYWNGTQVTRTQNFRLENAKYGADYSDSWYSTNAHFEKDTLKAEFPDAQWHRSVKLDSTDVYNKSIDGSKAYYKVRDYVATVTNVASIKDGFVKDAQKAVRPFTMKDTLSLRYYVEPDPEDEFVRRWMVVEFEDNEKIIKGAFVTREEWSISGVREVDRHPFERKATAQGQNYDHVVATTTSYETNGTKVEGTGNRTFNASAKNGYNKEGFVSVFNLYGDESITYTYKDCTETVVCSLICDGVQQNITPKDLKLNDGEYFNVSDYVASIAPVYTASWKTEKAEIKLNAESTREIWVKAKTDTVVEDQDFKANFKAEGAKLYHEDGQYANSWDEVEYTETVETGRKNVVRPLSLSGNVNPLNSYELEDASELGKLKVYTIKENATSTSKKEGNFVVKTTVATVTATFDNGKAQTIDFTDKSETAEGMSLGFATIDFEHITCKIDTVRVSEGKMKISPKYTVPVVITKIDGKTETKEFVIYNPFYETVKAKPEDKVDTVYTPSIANGQLIVLVERVVNDKDRTTIREDKYTPNFGITAKSAKDMYGKDYATTYNGTSNVQTNTVPHGYWTVESVKGQVTSTLSSGSDSDDNIADYGFDSKFTYKDGDYSYTWEGKMNLSDKTDVTDAGYKTINDVYYKVSDYKENFNGIYTIDGVEFGKPSDAVKRQILEAETVVDERSERVVSKKNNGFDVTTNFYKTYSFRGEKLMKAENDEMTFNYASRSHADMIAESATGYKTTSNGVSGSTYSNTLSNGTNSTNNVYDITLSTTKIVHSYDGMTETYEAKFEAGEVSSSVATNPTSKTVDGVNYNAYAYSNTTKGTLSLDGQNVSKEASTSYDILVKKDDVITTQVENKKYEAIFETSGANLTTKINANSWDVVTLTNGVETGRKTETHNLTVNANISGAQPFKVESKDDLSKEYKLGDATRTGNQVTTVTEDGVRKERTIQNFSVPVNNGQTLNVKVTTEKDLTDGMTLSHTYCENVKAVGLEVNVSGNTVTLTPKVNVMLVEDNGASTKAAVGSAVPYTIETSMVGTYTPETKVIRVPSIENGKPVVRTYNDVDGDRTLVDTEEFTPYYTLATENGQDVIAENTNFVTTFNGKSSVTSGTGTTQDHFTSSRENGKVTSTMSNGSVKADNIGNYSYDKTIVYKNGNDTFTFTGSANFAENTDAITAKGEKTVNNVVYDASAYKTTFSMAYTMTEATAGTANVGSKSASVSRDILVGKQAEDLVPGTIKWIALRAVAAIPDENGGYKNADGRMQRIKGVAVGTEEGKVCYIPFAGADDANTMLPTATQFSNANWQTASYYNESYVAGYDKENNGVWYPATVEEQSSPRRILYKDNDQGVRSLTEKSMNTWGWSKQTSVVDGYTISEVKNGVVTITFNGQTRVIK